MSSIDNRIVDMKFNNKQFESGISSTERALDKLKKALDLKGASKGLDEVANSSKKFDVSKMGGALDDLRNRFSTLGIIGISVLNNLVTAGMNAGVNFVKGMVQPIKDGLSEYETQINSVQTIMANTSSKGTTLTQVNDALDELNRYSDKTIYNFSEMTRNIGTFTAAGVDLDTSTNAIKGIANLAAVSGSNAQQASTAMYQLSQAMATGTVKLQDWNSIVNAGMGGQVFQDALKETARVSGVAIDDIIEKNGSFRDSLQDGWLTTDILTQTLSKFTGDMTDAQLEQLGYTKEQIVEIQKLGDMATDAATKVKTFTQLQDTLAEATSSGWGASWKIVLGDFEEAKALFTEVSDIMTGFIGRSADARNAQLQIWKDAGGRTAIIDGLRNSFNAVMGILGPIGEAFREVFPPSLGNTLVKLSFWFRDFTASLLVSEKGSSKIKTVATALFKALKVGLTIIAGLAKWFGDTAVMAFQLGAAVGSLIAPVATFLSGMINIGDLGSLSLEQIFDEAIKLRRMVFDPLIETIHNLGSALDELLNGDPIKFSQLFEKAFEPMTKLADQFRSKWESAAQWMDGYFGPSIDRIKDGWNEVVSSVKWLIGGIKPVAKAFADFFGALSGGMGEAMSGATFEQILATVNTVLIGGVILKIVKAFSSVKKVTEGFAGILDSVSGSFDGLTGVLKQMQNEVKANILLKIAASIAVLAGAMLILSNVDPARLQSSVIAMASLIGMLMGAMFVFGKVSSTTDSGKMNALALSLILMSVAIAILAGAVQKLGGMEWEELQKGLIGLSVALIGLTVAARILSQSSGNMMKSGVGLILMATALQMLVGVVALFGIMPFDVIVQGIGAVMVLLAGLTLAAVILNQFAPKMAMSALGLMAMAAAINMLLVPVMALGLLPFGVLVQGLGSLAVMLGILTLAAIAMSTVGPQFAMASLGIMAMAAAINMLVGPILILGVVPWQTLVTGILAVAGVMAVLVGAALLMNGAVLGAAGMVAMAGAILMLSVAVAVLGGMPIQSIAVALGALAAIFIILGIAALALGPLTPILIGLGGAMALLGLGVMLISASLVVFSIGLVMLAPALAIATVALLAFAEVAPKIMEGVPAFLAVGAGLLIFGIGALAAGAGVLLLGAALVVLGVGLALIGAVGIIGATALTAVVQSITELMYHIPGMLAMAGTFAVLGAAVVLLGAGLVVLGAGALLTGAALLIIGAAGFLVAAAFNMMVPAIERLLPLTGSIMSLGEALMRLGAALGVLAGIIMAAVAGLRALSVALMMVNVALRLTAALAVLAAVAMGVSMAALVASMSGAAAIMPNLVARIVMAIMLLGVGIMSASPKIVSAITVMSKGMIKALEAAVNPVTTAGQKIVKAILLLAIGILAASPRILAAIDALIRGIRQKLDSAVAPIGVSTQKIVKAILAIGTGITAGQGQVTGAASRLVGALNSTLASALSGTAGQMDSAGYNIGTAIISGMARGLANGGGTVANAARGVAQRALASAEATLGIASPSKEFNRIGRQSDEGLADGFDEDSYLVEKSAVGVAERALQSVKDALRHAAEVVESDGDIQPTITPVLDLSDIEAGAKNLSSILDSGASYRLANMAENSKSSGNTPSAVNPAPRETQTVVKFDQTIMSPKPISAAETYRHTKNLLSAAKEALNA